MKREGWQRGALKVSRNKLLRVAAAADDSEAPESVGVGVVVMEKAPAKLANASKSTGKCRRLRCSGCPHHHPVTKGRDKAKGAHKLRAYDVTLNHRLVSWRVVDGGGVGIPNYKGASASSILAHLAGSSSSSWYDDDEDSNWSVETAADGGLSDLYDLIVGPRAGIAAAPGEADPAEGDTDKIEEQQEQDGDHSNEDEDEDDEAMGFCIVGIKIALGFSDGEDDWIVVEEI